MEVALISVSVAVGLVALGCLARVAPHVVLQVGMSVHHALVEHRHDDGRVACAGLPRLGCIHVATRLGLGLVGVEVFETVVAFAQVAIMPLEVEAGVVGQSVASAACGFLLQGFLAQEDALGVGVVGTLDASVGLHLGDFAQLLQSLGSRLQVGSLVKLDCVPQVESSLACTRLVLGVNREHSLEAVAAQNVEHLIGRGNARTCGQGTAGLAHLCLVEYVAHLGAELDDQLTSLGVRRDGDVGLSACIVDGRQVVCATRQSHSEHRDIEKYFLHFR